MEDIVLQVKDVTIGDKKSGYSIVDKVNIEVKKQQIVGIVGESGCGKSMTSLAIMQLMPVNIAIKEGQILFSGEELTALKEKELRKVLGHAEVRQTFKASGVGTIAGSYVLDGTFERGCSVRVSRDGVVIFEGALASLKRFKDDVKEVRAGYECGLVFEKFNDVKEEDQVEAFKMVEVPR